MGKIAGWILMLAGTAMSERCASLETAETIVALGGCCRFCVAWALYDAAAPYGVSL